MPSTNVRAAARPYRDSLTPVLHQRFTKSAVLSLIVCYAVAVWMGDWYFRISQWDLFWILNPIGFTGLRTLLLFVSALAVYVLRVAQLHIGKRTALSGFNTLLQSASDFKTAQTLFWYTFSAWFYCEVYIWSRPVEANLAIMEPETHYQRSHLNERSIYIRTLFLCLGVFQSIVHLYQDQDRVHYPTERVKTELTAEGGWKNDSQPYKHLSARMLPAVRNVVARAVVMTFTGPLLYYLFLRQTAWNWTYRVAGYIFILPKDTSPPMYTPYIGDLIIRFFIESLLIQFMWESANVIFTAFVAQPPIKKGNPITDSSKDPNGSLLAGLKAKKEVTNSTAFWELVMIAYQFPTRRVSIFADSDRFGGSAWSQILTVCLGELHAVSKRIQDSTAPATSLPTGQGEGITSLPKIAQPLKNEHIFSKPAPPNELGEWTISKLGALAKQSGQSPGAVDPISPRAKKLLTYSADSLLTKQQQEQLTPTGIQSQFRIYLTQLLRTPVGIHFRRTVGRKASVVVLGSPLSRLSPILDSIFTLTKLATCSLKEDNLGQVHQDVANIIRVFTSTLSNVEGFVNGLQPHWTDVAFSESSGKNIPDIELVTEALRSGLRELIGGFGEYKDDLGLTSKELRLAKEAVGRGREVRQR